MTTPATERKAGPYSGNDSQTEFPFTFRVFSATNVQVVVSLSGIENSLILDTDYSVEINADQSVTPGGT
ncbi:MAG: phage tail protein, partial [Sphingomonas hengshuiensis]